MEPSDSFNINKKKTKATKKAERKENELKAA